MNRKCVSSVLAWAAVLGCALGAAAQGPKIDVNAGQNLAAAVAGAADGDTIVLEGPATYPGAFTITHDITIRGQDDVLPSEIIIDGGITIDGEADVTLAGIAVRAAGETAVKAMNGSALTMRRCYIIGSDTGVSMTGVRSGVITSSSISTNNIGLVVQSGGTVNVVQSSFFDNTTAIDVKGGTFGLYACIIDGNAQAITAPSVSVGATVRGNLISGPVSNVTPQDPVVVPLIRATSPEWIGDVATAVDAGITAEQLPEGIQIGTDFEDGARLLTPLQAGCDEEGGSLGLIWIDTRIITPFVASNGLPAVGLNSTARIEVRLGPGAVAGTARLRIKPEMGSMAAGQYIELQPTPLSDLAERTLVAEFSPPATKVNDLLLDGEASVYLDLNGIIYGLGLGNVTGVAPGALENSRFIIDTIPPKMITPNDAAVTAPFFISSVNDPDQVPFSSGTVGGAGDSTIDAKAFFNPQDFLGLSLTATFRDDPPLGTSVKTAGLPPLNGASSYTLTAGDILFPDGDPVPAAAPYWDPGFEGLGTYLLTSDPATVVYGSGGPILSAVWSFSIPIDRAILNDWRIGPRFNAIDLAGNVATSNDRDPVYFWWMLNAVARLTSFPYSGATALEPVFAWDLVRYGDSPGRSEPATPQAYYKLWATNNTDDPVSGTWVAITGWEGPSPDPNITINPTLLASDSVYMIVVRGIDEAGNDQLDNPTPGVNPVNFDDANISGLEIYNAMTAFNMPFVDFWRTPITGQGQVETAVIPEFWHDVDGNATPNQGEVRYGASRSIPYPANANARVAARFLIQVQSASGVTGISWEVYRDGQLILESDPSLSPLPWPPGGAELVLPLDLIGENMVVGVAPGDFVFGDPQRTQEFVLRVTGYDAFSTPIADPTPVTVQFRVVPEAELEKESGGIQPFKTFTRE
ncbi:MAG: right-handed parallel beta-helix repeat-containing protein [Candidatus Hydrogenedentes bacterium]|nr:right-handed parallel beta-helix repeat-containing protein [Candidatus Hydrogenedentota bacterium]